MQLSLQQKMMQGQEITEEDNQQAQEVVARIQQDAKITKLMETEQRLNVVIGDVNKIIMKPLEELYSAQQQAYSGRRSYGGVFLVIYITFVYVYIMLLICQDVFYIFVYTHLYCGDRIW